ncbi:MAG: insulinase family protein, partial [Gammaproteobacteria bacterium]|nr:insulinase family protein [Gammaproteobacteria bacterium]
AFISRHGGNHNAMTTHDHTHYFFDIDPAYLEPALDRFAQQFVAPLFNPEFVDRERHAVHSEFSASLREDGRRFHSAFKDIINPQHDYNTFAVGNLDTLADRPDDSVHAALLAFYAQHYSAQRMTLVVMGPQPLNVLEGWVKARFADIPGQPVDAQRPQASLFTDGTLPALLEVNAIKDVRSLRLSFPLPPQLSAYRTKPYAYVAHLIGHEGPGSILQVLKDAGLAEGLSAGLGLDLARESLLDIGISLTPQGLERWEDVVAVVFAGIEQIRREGIQETYFREEQRLMDIGLRFQERASPIHLVSALAMRLHEVPVEDVLVAPWLMSDYTPDAYRAILDRLTPDNLLVSLMTPGRVSADATDTRRSPWYQTHYRLSALDPNRVQAGTSSDAGVQALIARLALPAPNPFIPERLDLLGGPRMKTPERLIDDPGFTLWFAQDTEFGAPRANVYISFRSPESNRTARDAVLTRLWLDSVTDQLNALVYPAQLAGLDYAIYPHLRGLTLRVSGYNDKLDVLLREVLMAVRQTRFDPARFAQHRQALEEQLLNRRKQKPYEQAMRIAQESLLPGSWPLEARLDAVRAVGLADVQDMAQRFSRHLDTVVMAHGNLDRTA